MGGNERGEEHGECDVERRQFCVEGTVALEGCLLVGDSSRPAG